MRPLLAMVIDIAADVEVAAVVADEDRRTGRRDVLDRRRCRSGRTGYSAGRAKRIANCCSSSPITGIFRTPGDTSRLSVGQRRAAAMSTIRGSGLTTTGWPTAASSGVS